MVDNSIIEKIDQDRKEQNKRHERSALVYDRDKEIEELISNCEYKFNFENCLGLRKINDVMYIININIVEPNSTLKATRILNVMIYDLIDELKYLYREAGEPKKIEISGKENKNDFDDFVYRNIWLIDKFIDNKVVYDFSYKTHFYEFRDTLDEFLRLKKKFYFVTNLKFHKIYTIMYVFGLDMFLDRLRIINFNDIDEFIRIRKSEKILFFEKNHVCKNCPFDYCFDLGDLKFFK
ncbi:hypothetical protein DMUE_0463 [Dictyocoela muelleri]|nr:hypothetical protein DMUE_0463 [Dictyocoela muelleri]